MTSTQQTGASSDRVKDVSGIRVDRLECSICHDALWKPVACQSCETPFCSACINRWLSNNPNKCPNRCQSYNERKCPPFIAKLLAELEISCFYKSNGCQMIVPYEALQKHEIECDHQPQQCPGCRSKIVKKEFINHICTCASIELTCEDCKLVYKRGEAATKHMENICLKEQLRQVKEESKTLTLQLSELGILSPSLRKGRIVFDDLPSTVEELKFIPSTYRELKWTKFGYAHELFFKKNYPHSGYVTAFNIGYGPHIAYFSEEASIAIEHPNETFTFVSITACAAWNDNLQLTITGYRNSKEINTHTLTLIFGQPQLILLQWKNIDKVNFISSGGTGHPGTGLGALTNVVITQLTVNLQADLLQTRNWSWFN